MVGFALDKIHRWIIVVPALKECKRPEDDRHVKDSKIQCDQSSDKARAWGLCEPRAACDQDGWGAGGS